MDCSKQGKTESRDGAKQGDSEGSEFSQETSPKPVTSLRHK